MTIIGDNAKAQLTSFIERVERLNLEIKGLTDDKRDIFKEASSGGFDVKALRTIIKMRAEDEDDRAARESVLETYLHALGMI